MMTDLSTSMPCSCCHLVSTPKVPSTPWPLPPTTDWASSVMTESPLSAACTEAAKPEKPAPTTSTSLVMTSVTLEGSTTMPEELMVSTVASAEEASSARAAGAAP